ncbi:MAG: hypothetical protein Q8J90_01010, partial [Gallionella sp.]|nr:hypothetical protein [Gallionella sp.]
WNRSFIGVKTATVFPGNRARGLASVLASYLLLDGATGEPLALIDGRELTLRRTAAASALASRYLSRADSGTLLMVGTGALAPHLIRAHCRVRPIREVLIWGRTPEKAQALAQHAQSRGFALPPEVTQYLLRHGRRDLPSLMAALDALDEHSLRLHRAPSVPLLKEILQQELELK